MFFTFNWNNSYPSHLIWSLHDKYRVDTSFCANSHRNDYVIHCGNFHIRLTVLSVYWPLEVIRFLDAFNGDFNRLSFILIRITFEFVTDFWLIPPSIYPLNEGMCVCVYDGCVFVCVRVKIYLWYKWGRFSVCGTTNPLEKKNREQHSTSTKH